MSQAHDSLKQKIADTLKGVGVSERLTALLTRGDTTGKLIADNVGARQVWLHRNDGSQPFTAYLPEGKVALYRDGDTRLENVEVRLGKMFGSDTLQVMDTMTAAGQESVGNLSPLEEFWVQGYWAALTQITTFRAEPTSTASTSIQVNGPLWTTKPSTAALQTFTRLYLSLAATISAIASGKHQLCVVYYDNETNTLSFVTSTAVTAALTLPSRDEFASSDGVTLANTVPVTGTVVQAIYLYYGQAAAGVTESDFYRTWGDLRPLFTNPRAYVPITSSTPGTVARIVTATIGDGVNTNYTVTHNLNRQFLAGVTAWQTASPYQKVDVIIKAATVNTITVTVATGFPLSTNELTIVMTG